MIGLPRHLRPWASQLALFPEEIALALGAAVSRLSSIVGSASINQADEGSPDGYDGIARRGSYERVLPTEWLLLDEMPDEFLRRVVSGEHSFLRPAHRQNAAVKRCVVLFDTGVEQLGAPRIAHLAFLILLAQRAEQRASILEWGVLQAPLSDLRTDVTAAAVIELLRGRCARRVSAGDIERWVAHAQVAPPSELWLVGAEGLALEAARFRASVLTVSDVLEPQEPQRIRVTATSPRRERIREAILDVPSDRIAVQLLRDPFSSAVASRLVTTAAIDVASRPLFSADGRRLYVRGRSSNLVAFHVPNSPRAKPSPSVALALPEGHVAVAIGRSSLMKRTVVLSQRGDEAAVQVLSRRGATATKSARFKAVKGYTLPSVHASSPLLHLGVLENDLFCFITVEGDLVELSAGNVSLKDRASAFMSMSYQDCLTYVNISGKTLRFMRADAKLGGLEIRPLIGSFELPIIMSPCNIVFGAHLYFFFAYVASANLWTIVHHSQSTAISVPDASVVVGVVKHGSRSLEPCLVALSEGRTRLDLLHAERAQTLLTTAAPITNVAVSATGREIAFVTQAAELGVYSCAAEALVMRSAGSCEP